MGPELEIKYKPLKDTSLVYTKPNLPTSLISLNLLKLTSLIWLNFRLRSFDVAIFCTVFFRSSQGSGHGEQAHRLL